MSDSELRYGWYLAGTKLFIDIYTPELTEGEISAAVDELDPHKLTITLRGKKHILDLCGGVSDPCVNIKPSKAEISLQASSKVAFTHLLKSEKAAAKKHDKAEKYRTMDAAGEDDAPSDLMAVIRNIYQNGSDDTKRAMLKSYQVSCGTVLSTNWAEVSAGTVAPQLPE